MKSMKKIMTSTLVMVLLVASTLSVSANSSRNTDAYVSGGSSGYYEIGGCSHVEDENIPDHDGKTQITDAFDIVERNGGDVEDGMHQVDITVTTITNNMSDVVVSVQNPETGEWYTTTPASINYETGEMHLDLPWVGCAVVYANVSGVSGSAQGTSPATANNSAWALWMCAAVVMCATGVAVSKKHN